MRILSLQERVPLEEVFTHLRCSKEGLTAGEVQERLAVFGHNKLEEKKVFCNHMTPAVEYPNTTVSTISHVEYQNCA